MSLLEDAFYLLRSILEYFGVPPDMLVPVWESQLCGQYRSVVRMIGSNLPLTPSARVHFQIPLHTYRPHGYVDVTMDTPAIPSLADVLWVAEDEGDSFAKIRNYVHPFKQSSVHGRGDVVLEPGEKVGYQGLASLQPHNSAPVVGQRSEPEAMRKITALEDELLKLRAQIAMIVLAAPPTAPPPTQNVPDTPESLLSPPTFTSTPRCAPPHPPPPPPPPPPPSSSPVVTPSTVDLIRQRREARQPSAQVKGSSQGQPHAQDQGVPSMLDVLKNLNQVKLRTLERSPGGTPMRKRRSRGPALPSDPAALIAEALRKKFAYRRFDDSNDKENRSAELSPFGSPEVPSVPQLSRQSKGRLHR